jgi:alpha-N-arabinofuranosidase
MDGIGPRDQRPERLEMAWRVTESNRFGTHEFLDYTEKYGFEPYICANLGTGTWDEAQKWVEYTNLDGETEMVRMRRRNGRAKPWKVTYWGLGNEMDGPWQMGHRSAEDYGKFALEAAKLMKWTDPSIKLIAAGSSNYGADWIGWNRVVLDHLKNHADYLSLHLYVGNRANDYDEFLASSLDLAEKIKIAEGTIRAATAADPRRKIYIAWDEWNVWYRARGENGGTGRRALEERYNLEDALVVATMLNAFVNNAHIVKIANLAQLVNVIAPIFTNEKGLFLQTIYYPIALFAKNVKGNALDVFVDSPAYKSKRFEKVGNIDASAALDGSSLVVNLVNRHKDQAIDTAIECEDRKLAGAAEATVVNGGDVKDQNDFGSTKVQSQRATAEMQNGRLVAKLPPHSFTQIRVKLA